MNSITYRGPSLATLHEQYAKNGRIDDKAPIRGGRAIMVEAPAEAVWRTLVDVERWPETMEPDIKHVSVPDGVVEGAEFTRKIGRAEIRAKFAVVNANRELAWTGSAFGANVVHRFALEPANGATKLIVQESMAGRFLGTFFNVEALNGSLERNLRLLKRASEARVGAAPLTETPAAPGYEPASGSDKRVASALDAGSLMDAARSETGLDDYGDLAFVEGLSAFTKAGACEAALTEDGIRMIEMGLVRNLSNRLRFAEQLRLHPEITAEEITRPIVIIGLARSGTTKLQRVLSSDPRSQRLELWRLLNPAPYVDDPNDPEARIAFAEAVATGMEANFPDIGAAHSSAAREVDEELYLLELSFESHSLAAMARVPSYADWLAKRSLDLPYAYLRQMLQYLQWQDGGARGRHWVLKCPYHLGELETLTRTFPDAILIHCHRELMSSIPSAARLLEVLRETFSDAVNLADIGRDSLSFAAEQMDRYLAQRARLSVKIIDVPYRRVRSDTAALIADIYGAAGIELTAEAAAAMAGWSEANPQQSDGHAYSLERFGLTEAAINDAFVEYMSSFGELISSNPTSIGA
jgi:hypothetical protein